MLEFFLGGGGAACCVDAPRPPATSATRPQAYGSNLRMTVAIMEARVLKTS